LQDPISQTTIAKWAGGMAQVLEHLPSKSEALSSNPSPIEKKNVFLYKIPRMGKLEKKGFGISFINHQKIAF
jgi:hypothetical protein